MESTFKNSTTTQFTENQAEKNRVILYDSKTNPKRIKHTYMMPRIVAFIPAHNEEKSIRDCLTGVRDQILPKNVQLDIFVIADNCTDRTEEKAFEAAKDFGLNVIVLTTKNNKQRKVGALNTAWKYIYGDPLEIYAKENTAYQKLYQQSIKGILGMDADSRLAPGALKHLWDDLMSQRNIGGVMAKYTMRMPKKKRLLAKDDVHYEEKIASGEYGGSMARWWTHQQKQDMASWLLNLQYNGGSTYVLGGRLHYSVQKPYKILSMKINWMDLGKMIVMLRICC